MTHPAETQRSKATDKLNIRNHHYSVPTLSIPKILWFAYIKIRKQINKQFLFNKPNRCFITFGDDTSLKAFIPHIDIIIYNYYEVSSSSLSH